MMCSDRTSQHTTRDFIKTRTEPPKQAMHRETPLFISSCSNTMSRETEEEKLHSNRWHISSSKHQAFSFTSSAKLLKKEPSTSRHSLSTSEVMPESARRDFIPQIPSRSWHEEGTRTQHDYSPRDSTTPNKRTEGNAESDDVASSLRPSGSRFSYNTSPMKPIMSLDKLAPCPGSSRWDIGECIDHGISIASLDDDNDALQTHTKRSQGLGSSLPGDSPHSKNNPKRKKVSCGLSTTTSKHYVSSGPKHKLSSKMSPKSEKDDDKADTRKNMPPSSLSSSSLAATTTKSYIPTRHLPKKLHRKQKEERRRRRTAVNAALSSILEEEADEE
jgi:hypothetical protein